MSHSRRRLRQIASRTIKSAVLALGGLIFLLPVQAEQPPPTPLTAPLPTPVLVDTVQPIQPDPALFTAHPDSLPPIRLLIPRLAIDLPVVEAQVVDGYWELSATSASHGLGSANPGDGGNMVIFAHARPGLFLPLRQITPGDTVYIFTAARWYSYSVVSQTEVTPDQVEVLAPTPQETLTLFTCSGFSDSRRLIVTARPAF